MKNLRNIRELNKEIRWFLYLFIPFLIFGVFSSIILGLIIGAML